MLRFLRDKGSPLLLGAILFGLLVLLSAQVRQGGASLLEATLLRLTAPVVRTVSGTAAAAEDSWRRYVDLRGAREEARALAAEVRRLRLDNSRLQAVIGENATLRRLLAMRDAEGWDAVGAGVLANRARGNERTLLLDRGERDGVRRDQPVMAPEGVVGRVVAVSPGSAKVQLITDADSAVAVVVERTGLLGLLRGRSGDRLRLRHIPALEDLQVGDRLRTSGMDGIYPVGYPAGTVVKVGADTGILKDVEVAPAVDLTRVTAVLVLRTTWDPGVPALPSIEEGP